MCEYKNIKLINMATRTNIFGRIRKTARSMRYKIGWTNHMILTKYISLSKLPKQELHAENLRITVAIDKVPKSMYALSLEQTNKKPSGIQVVNALTEMINFAKRNDLKKIYAITWIFAEYPLIAKKLGFKIENQNTLDDYRELIEKITKKYGKVIIRGINFETESLEFKTENNEIKFISLLNHELPLFVAEI